MSVMKGSHKHLAEDLVSVWHNTSSNAEVLEKSSSMSVLLEVRLVCADVCASISIQVTELDSV